MPRVVDYFAIVGASEQVRADVWGKKTSRRMFDPELLQRYPAENYSKHEKFNDDVKMFCFPNGVRAVSAVPASAPFSFVMTQEDGTRLYCVAALDYVGPPDNKDPEAVFIPKAICLISHWQFYNQMTQILTTLLVHCQSGLMVPIERILCSLILETPLPPPGRLSTHFTGLNAAIAGPDSVSDDYVITFSRPPPNRIPLRAWSFTTLLKCLSPDTLLLVYGSVLTEQRILFCSKFQVSRLPPLATAALHARSPRSPALPGTPRHRG
jgi:hypothetical protein